MIRCHFKCFLYSFTDCNGRNYYDKFTPAISFVQLKHCLDINICLAGTGFHLNIQRASSQIFDQIGRKTNVILTLYSMNILQQLFIRKFNPFIFITGVIFQVNIFLSVLLQFLHISSFKNVLAVNTLNLFPFSLITDITDSIMISLSLKNLNNSINSVRLILLYFEIEFHKFHHYLSSCIESLINIFISF